MPEIRCPQCQTLLYVDRQLAGEVIACVNCGQQLVAPRPAPPGVIDVQAEVVGEEADEPAAKPTYVTHAEPQSLRPGGRTRVRSYRYEGAWSGLPCCTAGCLTILLLAYILYKGLEAIFS